MPPYREVLLVGCLALSLAPLSAEDNDKGFEPYIQDFFFTEIPHTQDRAETQIGLGPVWASLAGDCSRVAVMAAWVVEF